MNTFYFNTGVKPENVKALATGAIWRGGTMQFPFDADAPKNAILKFICDDPDQPKSDRMIVREIFNTHLIGKYAYFLI